jgi:hypothetical protein
VSEENFGAACEASFKKQAQKRLQGNGGVTPPFSSGKY